MTVIVGIAEHGRVVMGGDSAGVGGWDLTTRSDPKVFRNGPFVIGFTDSFRMGQLLRFAFKPPDQADDQDDYGFMVTTFVDAVRECLKAGGYAKKDQEAESGGRFLVGYRGCLYMIDRDYQVAIPSDRFAAVGCGAEVARGALYATDGQVASERVLMALQAAEHLNAGVRGPFVIVNDLGMDR